MLLGYFVRFTLLFFQQAYYNEILSIYISGLTSFAFQYVF